MTCRRAVECSKRCDIAKHATFSLAAILGELALSFALAPLLHALVVLVEEASTGALRARATETEQTVVVLRMARVVVQVLLEARAGHGRRHGEGEMRGAIGWGKVGADLAIWKSERFGDSRMVEIAITILTMISINRCMSRNKRSFCGSDRP